MGLMHQEFKIYNNMRIIICALLSATIHLSCRLKTFPERNFIKLQKNWPKNFKDITDALSQEVLSLYQKAQSLN